MQVCLKPGLLAFLVGIILWMGCKPTQNNNSPEDLINQIALEKLGAEFDAYPSPDKSFVLFTKKLSPSAANTFTKFIVIETTSHKVVIEKSYKPGYVKWINDSILELLDAPGIVKHNEDLSPYVRRIDIASSNN
ncbi:MAG: hypothetical protein JNM78_07405 [Cyclobacteriaceae bacterium]|nr:hypothetical protein [Cyclobacteriaceae bacterium]